MHAAAKVGLFVIVFGALLLGSYALLQKSFFAKPVDLYYADFADVGGVATGSAVLFAGVKVGQVKEVKLLGPQKARLTLAFDQGTLIPKGSTALIPASFISIGDMKVQIIATSTTSEPMRPGDVLEGKLGSPLDALAPQGGKTLEEVNKTLVSIQGLLGDKGMKSQLSELLTSVNVTTKKFGSVATRIDGLLAANQGKFSSLLASTSGTLQNMQAVSSELRKLVASGELQGKTTKLLDNLNLAVVKGQELVASMQGFVNDPELRAGFKDTMGNLKIMSDSGTKIAANAEVMSSNGVEISAETKILMKKANALADQVQSLVERFNKTVDKLGGQPKSMTSGLEFEGTLAQESRPGRRRIDANMFIPVGKDKVMIGLYDAFESNKINLQLKRQISPNLGLRYGSYASKPGIGVDYDLASKLGLRTDLFGLNDPRLDFRLNYKLSPGVAGWAGVNNVFERATPSIGVTVRK